MSGRGERAQQVKNDEVSHRKKKEAERERLSAERALRPAPDFLPDKAKADWHTYPESWRVWAWRRMDELLAGIAKYKLQAEEHPLAKFRAHAEAQGLTLEQYIEKWKGMEDAIRSDPAAGMIALCKEFDIDPQSAAQLWLDVARRQECRAVLFEYAEKMERGEIEKTPKLEKFLGDLLDRVNSEPAPVLLRASTGEPFAEAA